MSPVTFSALATAAYCPRKLHYRERDGRWAPPPEAEAVRALAFGYGSFLSGEERPDPSLLAVEPRRWRANLERARSTLTRWSALRSPAGRDRFVSGRHCRGRVDKVLEDPPGVSLVSTGTPPEEGTWRPQRVRAVAAAKALAWELRAPVEYAYIEHPAHGVVRRVPLDGRRRAEYRRVLRTVRTMDGVPPRLPDRAKCTACDYRETCGVRTWSLRSLLG